MSSLRSHIFFRSIAIAILTTSLLAPRTTAGANLQGAAWNQDTRAFSEGWPWPSLPNWWTRTDKFWSSQTFTDVRLGQWLPCKPEWSMNDCIKEINVYDQSGKKIGPLTYLQEPGFDPFEIPQVWSRASNMEGTDILDNFPDFSNAGPVWSQGWWQLPDGVKLSDGKNLVLVSAARMQAALQVNITPRDLDKGVSLPVGYFFETTLKSENLKKYATWITSNGKDPTAIFNADGTIVIRGEATRFPNPGPIGCEKLNLGNEEKAQFSAAFIAVNLSTASVFENPNYTAVPGDIVMGTNGWWCQGGVYWDAKERQIVVNVAATHFYEDGVTEVDGWLEVKIRGELARHWWGISPQEATGYAKVEITYKDGQSKTATVSAKYVPERDWIDLRAYGFTYSNPAVKISMAKPEPEKPVAQPTPSATPAPVATTASRKTSTKKITCFKGSSVKRVSTKTCPKGFKRR